MKAKRTTPWSVAAACSCTARGAAFVCAALGKDARLLAALLDEAGKPTPFAAQCRRMAETPAGADLAKVQHLGLTASLRREPDSVLRRLLVAAALLKAGHDPDQRPDERGRLTGHGSGATAAPGRRDVVSEADDATIGGGRLFVRRAGQGFVCAALGKDARLLRALLDEAGEPTPFAAQCRRMAEAPVGADLAKVQRLGLTASLRREADPVLRRLLVADALLKAGYNPDERRDECGQWTSDCATEADTEPGIGHNGGPPLESRRKYHRSRRLPSCGTSSLKAWPNGLSRRRYETP